MHESLAQTDPPAPPPVIDRGVLPTTEVIARVHRIQEVMKALMKRRPPVFSSTSV